MLEVLDADGNNVADLYPFPSAPPHSGALALDAVLGRIGPAEIQAFAGWTYTGERLGVVITEERRGHNRIGPYGLYNARLALAGLGMGAGELDIALWGRNLGDKVYPVIAIDNLPHSDRAVVWGAPRSVGLDLVYRFR